jgi:hypothetical protein
VAALKNVDFLLDLIPMKCKMNSVVDNSKITTNIQPIAEFAFEKNPDNRSYQIATPSVVNIHKQGGTFTI